MFDRIEYGLMVCAAWLVASPAYAVQSNHGFLSSHPGGEDAALYGIAGLDALEPFLTMFATWWAGPLMMLAFGIAGMAFLLRKIRGLIS